jgi:hypothetical protein
MGRKYGVRIIWLAVPTSDRADVEIRDIYGVLEWDTLPY